jgi:hypothetical protein
MRTQSIMSIVALAANAMSDDSVMGADAASRRVWSWDGLIRKAQDWYDNAAPRVANSLQTVANIESRLHGTVSGLHGTVSALRSDFKGTMLSG